MTGAPLLSFDDLTFGYRPKQTPVLQGLNLELKAGRVAVILGPNGAGKTTLLHLALGWLCPWQGSVCLGGKKLKAYTHQELGRWMALVPQSEHIPFEYSVFEYLLLGRAPHLPPLGMPGEADYAAAFEALESIGIASLSDHSILTLSGGERQLALVARALTQQPRLLLLDEPTAHLDLHNKARIVQVMRALRASGVTILMTTHEPDVALALADDVILMHHGQVLAYGPVETAFTAENLSRLYGLPIRVAHVEGGKQVIWL
jgi:iron complex transport system ATP-binding protein